MTTRPDILQDCDLSELCGAYGWSLIHAAAENFPCASCAREGGSLMRLAHDLVNYRLGKPVQYPNDAQKWRPIVADFYRGLPAGRGRGLGGDPAGRVAAGNNLVLEQGLPAPFGWPGGKRLLRKQIIALIPPHQVYVEPFAGAANVFWGKEPSQVEVLNDLDADLMRFYHALKQPFQCNIPAQFHHSYEKLKEFVRQPEGNLSPCAFLARVVCSFATHRASTPGQKTSRWTMCMNNAPQFHRNLSNYQTRIKGVKLHNQNWEQVVQQYDGASSFFYLDPPYEETTNEYLHSDSVLVRLAQVLPTLKGKWLLSYNDISAVRKAFRSFSMRSMLVTYNMNVHSSKRSGKELLIANYPLPGAAQQHRFAAENHLSKDAISLDLAGAGDYIRERLVHPQACHQRSFRTIDQGSHKLVLCCPQQHWHTRHCDANQVPQARLHPRSEERLLVREALDLGIPVLQEAQQDGDKPHLDEDALKDQIQDMVDTILKKGDLARAT